MRVSAAAGLAMPLARSAAPVANASDGGGLIQRQTIGGSSGEGSSSPAAVSETAAFSPAAGSASTSAAAGPDIDDVVDQVMRRLTRTLAVESERHGGRRWP